MIKKFALAALVFSLVLISSCASKDEPPGSTNGDAKQYSKTYVVEGKMPRTKEKNDKSVVIACKSTKADELSLKTLANLFMEIASKGLSYSLNEIEFSVEKDGSSFAKAIVSGNEYDIRLIRENYGEFAEEFNGEDEKTYLKLIDTKCPKTAFANRGTDRLFSLLSTINAEIESLKIGSDYSLRVKITANSKKNFDSKVGDLKALATLTDATIR